MNQPLAESIKRQKGQNGHLLIKNKLTEFWLMFGGKKCAGGGHNSAAKMDAVKALSFVVIDFHKQKPKTERREEFNESKATLHKFTRFDMCFICSTKRASARHHLIQLQHGGINSKKNVISVCNGCHEEIHPWMKA